MRACVRACVCAFVCIRTHVHMYVCVSNLHTNIVYQVMYLCILTPAVLYSVCNHLESVEEEETKSKSLMCVSCTSSMYVCMYVHCMYTVCTLYVHCMYTVCTLYVLCTYARCRHV